MKKFIPLLGLLLFACSKNDSEIDAGIDAAANEVTFSTSITTRATDTEFEVGDVIYVTAYSEGVAKYTNVSYTFKSSGLFGATSSAILSDGSQEFSYLALYPVVIDGKTFTVQSDQNSGSNYTLSDLMSSTATATTSSQPKLTFDHLMTKIKLNITSDVEVKGATISAIGSVNYDSDSNSVTAASSASSTITMRSLGSDSYDAIIAPQAINNIKITITDQNDSQYEVSYDNIEEASSGYVYTATVKIENEQVTIVDVDFSGDVNDWQDGILSGNDSNVPDGYTAIYTAQDMYDVRADLVASYILMNDIDLSSYESWDPIGVDDTIYFGGNFDGNGYTISGLKINSTTSSYQALFGYTYGATIENVIIKEPAIEGCNYTGVLVGYAMETNITNCGIEGGSISGDEVIGGVVGFANSSSVTFCHNSGSVSGGFIVSGVVGWAASSTLSACYNTGSVEGSDLRTGGVVGFAYSSSLAGCYNTGSVKGVSYVGGVAGWIRWSSSLTACYNSGSIEGSDDSSVGGMVGYASVSSSLTACYNSGSVLGSSSYVGGVLGHDDSSSSVTDCFYLPYDDLSYTSTTDGTADENLVATMTSTDFPAMLNAAAGEEYFEFDAYDYNGGYPILTAIDYSAIGD